MAKGDGRKFLAAFLKSPGSVGAIAPSSAALAAAMVRDLHVPSGATVIEFGPGTGAFTPAIAGVLEDPRSYLGIEIEPRFVALLAVRFPDLRFVEGSAADACDIAREQDVATVRAVISGLPFASLNAKTQDGIVASLERLLGPGAEFRTFQYVHAYVLPNATRFRRRMSEILGPHERSRVVVRNLPPAYVLRWTREAGSR